MKQKNERVVKTGTGSKSKDRLSIVTTKLIYSIYLKIKTG